MSFPAVNAQRTSDAYTDATTMRCPDARRINLDVSGAAIYYQLGDGVGGILWRTEIQMGPGFRSLDQRADAVRARSATPGAPATVTISAVPESELGDAGA